MSEGSARILALDLGEARIGVALSDPLGMTAQPLGALRRRGSRQDPEAVAALAREHGAAEIVVGHPLLLSGEAGTRAKDAEAFADGLRRAAPELRVELLDERFTTVEVERAMIAGGVRRKRRREVVDSLAATLILQSYLARRDARDGAE